MVIAILLFFNINLSTLLELPIVLWYLGCVSNCARTIRVTQMERQELVIYFWIFLQLCQRQQAPLSHSSTVCVSIMFHCRVWFSWLSLWVHHCHSWARWSKKYIKSPVIVSGWASAKKSNSSITEVTSLHGHGSCYHIWFAFVSTKPLLFVAGAPCLASRVTCHEKIVGGHHEEPRTHMREGRDSLPANLPTHMLRETDFKSSAQTFSI